MNVFNYIKSQVPLADVIGEYVGLKAKGEYLKGDCPFCDDATRCLNVSPVKQTYLCFNCGAAGDVIAFTAKIKNITPDKAAEFLMKTFNLTLPQQ